jgi:hypothetical protein
MAIVFNENSEAEFNGQKFNMFGENIPIESTLIKHVCYHPFTSILEITFKSEIKYTYFSVPKSVFLKLVSAESKGESFHKLIRSKKYQYKRINE